MQNVVQFSSRRPDRRCRELEEIDAYWSALRGARAMPSRVEIGPGGIGDALPRAFILQRIGPGRTRLRLAGQDLRDLMGMELRGMPLIALFVPQARDRIEEIGEAVFARPAIADVQLRAEVGPGTPPIKGRMKLWSLTDHRGRPDRCLGTAPFRDHRVAVTEDRRDRHAA